LLPRIAFNSGESLLYLLRRCRGDYIGICPSDGHFLPDALKFAVEAFEKNPGAGMICGENFLIDAHGKSLADVDVVTLLFTPYRPFLPTGFFRRRALVDVGLVKRKSLPIKILGSGDLTKAIVVQAHKFSKSAEAKIRAAGGRVEVIPGV
jgi:hypothetical protein